MQESYIEKILKARVYDVAIESPLEAAPRLSRRLGNRVLFKREDLQPVFSFKLRGAYNRIAHLPEEVARRGVICASAGNHAQGVALAARRRGIPAVIVMPQTTPSIKGLPAERSMLSVMQKCAASCSSVSASSGTCANPMPRSSPRFPTRIPLSDCAARA